MAGQKKVKVAIIGLGFGAEFIPIYQRHPDVEMYAICQRNPERLKQVGDAFKVPVQHEKYADVLADPEVDFVHINSPIPDHAAMSLAALRAGKHVMCTVPMATTVDDCRQIVELSEKTGRKYMMAETVVYAREFLFLRELYQKGELGRIQFVQASHQQDMDGWPNYWPGLPPIPCPPRQGGRRWQVRICRQRDLPHRLLLAAPHPPDLANQGHADHSWFPATAGKSSRAG